MSAYTPLGLDLSVPRAQVVIDGTQANPVDAVYVVKLPAPAQIHFGNAGGIDLEQGKSYEPCPPETGGVFITNASAGGTLKLLVSYDQGG